MMRQVCILVIVAVAVGSVEHSRAQSPSSTASSQAELAQAKQLDGRVDKLYGEGKFQEAIPLAEQSLALREKTQGPMHPDVAKSLNDLAELYREQGAYGKAEPLYVRALDIREKVLGASAAAL